MVMSRVHPGQIQLPVLPSLALEDVGDQESLGVSVLKGMLMCATKKASIPGTEKPWDLVWEGQANCSLPQELGIYLQSKYQTRIK